MKVFLDTNVWVSAFLAPGLCEELLFRCINEGVALTSPLMWSELRGVLERKVSPSPRAIRHIEFLRGLTATIADMPEPSGDNDARLVAAAAAAGADLFVTGDRRLIAWERSGGMRMVSPRQAWVILFPPVQDH